MSNIIDISVINELKEIGDDDFLIELVDMFLQQADTLVDDIQKHFENKDADSLSKAAHKLKGSCLNLGAKDMGDVCQTIEHTSRDNSFENLDNEIKSLLELYKLTSAELKTIVSK